MADITRRTAKILLDQMLKQYSEAMKACIDDRDVIPAEALQIVNDYENNQIGKLIDKILNTKDYFSNYDAESYFKFFDNMRALIKGFDLKLPRDVELVDSIIDKESIVLISKNEKKLLKPKERIKLQLLKGEEENDLSSRWYNVEWSVENITSEKISKYFILDALENNSVLFDQTNRSFTFKEAGKYRITAYVYEQDIWGRKELADVLTYEQEVVGENKILPETWKIYLDKNNQIKDVKYGPDKTKAQVINSNGNVGSVIDMTGSDYENKGFAKKLLTAAGITATDKADFELQEKMLDSGLFYINKKEGWIEKEKYFERMTPPDFLTIQDYKDVTVKAVYEDAKGELTFTYTAGGKTENLFVIKASNRQMEREFPSKSGSNSDKQKADPSNIYAGYIPKKFPKGIWNITLFKETNDVEYGPYQIRTDAYRYVEAWDYVFDEDLDTKIWKKRLDKNGKVVKVRDEGLLIHGGGYSESDLDNKRGSNKYTDTTLGCIRISNLDVYLIVHVLQKYMDVKGNISLEVK